MTIAIVAGTRPEALKITPIINKFKEENIDFKVILVSQHKDLLKDFEHDIFIDVPSSTKDQNRLDDIVAYCLFQAKKALQGIDWLIVQGDTSSAFAMALAAFHNGVKVIHVEAGLRTFDKLSPYPEEMNRQLISRIADLHFAPTWENETNLFLEGIKSYVTRSGNTVYDGVEYPDNNVNPTDVLITMHRREKSDEDIKKWVEAYCELQTIYSDLKFKFIKHPRLDNNLFKEVNFEVIEPVEHPELLKMIANSRFVITDSGGIQEECSFMNVKCFITRDNTERPESLGLTSYLCPYPNRLIESIASFMNSSVPEEHYKCPYTFGQGVATKIIIATLKQKGII